MIKKYDYGISVMIMTMVHDDVDEYDRDRIIIIMILTREMITTMMITLIMI